MTHYKHEAKQAAHSKMERMGLHKEHSSKKHFDDVHPYDGVPQLNTDMPSGAAPVGKQRFKRGGKVAHLMGDKAKHNLGKKPRGKYKGDGFVPVTSPNHPMNKDISTRGITDNKGHYVTDDEIRRGADPFASAPLPPQRPAPMPPERPAGLKSGGVAGFNPALRKKRAAAMAIRKKKEGIPYSAPMNPGVGMSSGIIAPHKKGGAVHRHEDVAADKKLIKSMVKGEALKHRAHKLSGGALEGYIKKAAMKRAGAQRGMEFLERNGAGGMGTYNKYKDEADRRTKGIATAASKLYGTKGNGVNVPASDEMCWGGRAKRKDGGRTKGKTNINIIISPEGQKGAAPMPAGGPPAIPPQLLAAMAGGGAGGPPGGMPPGGPPPGALPSAGAGPGLGAMGSMAPGKPGMSAPVPPMAGGAMGRKTGGRVGGKAPQAAMPTHQEHDYGSGSGLGRLEKRKWPLAK